MDGDEAILTKFGATNSKDTPFEVHITTIQVCDLSRAQTGAREETDNSKQREPSHGVER
ncbi:hypothetical protein SBA1_1740002 [Candidatus Sulfotelmatobacter kueseliae]|uniref:Uncharacterized protein n=1 Tax=Candidatus Sulfotelmatobacter kueseliae TaxID=2042962 RepID=A0A2U3KC50_9BACT|nr:hypothetical protein SBA1_1740002 [Candidatus Sulfotelmatobacter kueseliae]